MPKKIQHFQSGLLDNEAASITLHFDVARCWLNCAHAESNQPIRVSNRQRARCAIGIHFPLCFFFLSRCFKFTMAESPARMTRGEHVPHTMRTRWNFASWRLRRANVLSKSADLPWNFTFEILQFCNFFFFSSTFICHSAAIRTNRKLALKNARVSLKSCRISQRPRRITTETNLKIHTMNFRSWILTFNSCRVTLSPSLLEYSNCSSSTLLRRDFISSQVSNFWFYTAQPRNLFAKSTEWNEPSAPKSPVKILKGSNLRIPGIIPLS